jgi:hypothetical protein
MTTIHWVIIGGLLAAVITAGGISYIFDQGVDAGADNTRAAVSTETVRATEAARQDKEKVDEKVRRTPLDVLIDGQLR